MAITRLTRAKTPTGRMVQQVVTGIKPTTPMGKIAVALGAEIGGAVADEVHRAFVNAGWGLGNSPGGGAEWAEEVRRRAHRAHHADQARRQAQAEDGRAQAHSPRPAAGPEGRTYRFDGKIVVNYYETLEVSPKARASVIEKAYRALMTEDHPDHGGDSRKAQMINEAYQVLRDPAKRRRYDEQNGFR